MQFMHSLCVAFLLSAILAVAQRNYAEDSDATAAATLLVTYSDHCGEDRTDLQVAKDIAKADLLRRRRLRQLNDDSAYEDSDNDDVEEIEAALLEELRRFRRERIIDAKSLAVPRFERRRLAAAAARGTSSPTEIDFEARRTLSELQPISEVSVEERRDRLMAILSVAAALRDAIFPVDSDYLSNLKIEVIYSATDGVKELVSQLPCLTVPPEWDRAERLAERLPNDLHYQNTTHSDQQWGHLGDKSGLPPYGSRVTDAWDTFTAAGSNFVVAVVDTGCSMHPDLEQALCKEDENCAGYDFGDDDANPFDEPLEHTHGTGVASIIAARPNNSFGMAGVCWGCRIMCLKVWNSSSQSVLTSSVLMAYNYIVAKKVKVSNNSFTSFGWLGAEYAAIQWLNDWGHLVVAPAGNDGCNLDQAVQDTPGCKSLVEDDQLPMVTPASYDCENLLVVGAITSAGGLLSGTNWGKDSVDIMAPGEDILALENSLHSEKGFTYKSGTSYATPYVVGAAALAWARDPLLTVPQIKKYIMNNAKKISQMEGLSVSGGILDVNATVSAISWGIIDEGYPEEEAPVEDHSADYYNQTPTESRASPPCFARTAAAAAFTFVFLTLFFGIA